jgi:hypothetical protein
MHQSTKEVFLIFYNDKFFKAAAVRALDTLAEPLHIRKVPETCWRRITISVTTRCRVRQGRLSSHLRERRFSGLGRQERAEKRTMCETEVQIANSGLIEICFEDGPSFRVRS